MIATNGQRERERERESRELVLSVHLDDDDDDDDDEEENHLFGKIRIICHGFTQRLSSLLSIMAC